MVKFATSRDIADRFQYLRDAVEHTRDWREQKAAEYPDDPRNEQCARAR